MSKRDGKWTSEYNKKYYIQNKERLKEYSRVYYYANTEKCKKKQIGYNRRTKLEVLAHYSKGDIRCNCCGETFVEFLCIDHINGGGGKEKRDLKKTGGTTFYKYLITHGFPQGYRVLCHNCNMAFGIYGYCPHQPPLPFRLPLLIKEGIEGW